MKPRLIAVGLIALCLPACLENEEEITIQPDGSAAVRLEAKGRADDFTDGYPMPLRAPWIPADNATLEWLRVLGPDTGSAAVRENLRLSKSQSGGIDPSKDTQLEVGARFPSVEDMPRWFAPEDEPYRTAYLERETHLSITHKGTRTVYDFERSFRAREFQRFDVWSLMKQELDEDVRKKVEDSQELTAEERTAVVSEAVSALRKAANALVLDALGSLYTQGDASLPAQSTIRARSAIAGAVEGLVTHDRLGALLDLLIRTAGKRDLEKKEDEARGGQELAELEREIRDTLRHELELSLQREGADVATRNAILGRLEWRFSACDQTSDLGDEKFEVWVKLPGTLVGGDYDDVDEGRAHWTFSGEDLRDRDRILRAISVVE